MAGSWLLLLLLAFRVSSCFVATSGWASSEAFLVQVSGVLGSAMAASPPGLGRFRAATCRRWGDVGALVSVARKEARRHYFMRVARRAMRTRKPALASRSRSASAAQVAVLAAMAAPRLAPPALTRASLPSQARPRMANYVNPSIPKENKNGAEVFTKWVQTLEHFRGAKDRKTH